LRISIIAAPLDESDIVRLADAIVAAWRAVRAEMKPAAEEGPLKLTKLQS
jgi:hypothetical protein